MPNLNELFPIFASLIGAPAFIAALVNTAKYFGILQDTQAPKAVLWLTLLEFAGVAVAFFLDKIPVLIQVDLYLGSLALFMLSFVSFLTELGLAKLYNLGLRGTPVIGKSYSQEADEKA